MNDMKYTVATFFENDKAKMAIAKAVLNEEKIPSKRAESVSNGFKMHILQVSANDIKKSQKVLKQNERLLEVGG